jgi:hypothetical protein
MTALHTRTYLVGSEPVSKHIYKTRTEMKSIPSVPTASRKIDHTITTYDK